MITNLTKSGVNEFEVNVLRNSASSPRTGSNTTIFSDVNITLTAIMNDGKSVGYILNFKGNPLVHNTAFSVSLFYRKSGMEYTGRKHKVVYADKCIRLLRFGNNNYDYIFVTLKPVQEHRGGDKRFSTVANGHGIEEEDDIVEVDISAIQGHVNVKE